MLNHDGIISKQPSRYMSNYKPFIHWFCEEDKTGLLATIQSMINVMYNVCIQQRVSQSISKWYRIWFVKQSKLLISDGNHQYILLYFCKMSLRWFPLFNNVNWHLRANYWWWSWKWLTLFNGHIIRHIPLFCSTQSQFNLLQRVTDKISFELKL